MALNGLSEGDTRNIVKSPQVFLTPSVQKVVREDYSSISVQMRRERGV